MSCYFRHIPEILKEAGIKVTTENKREVDRLIHSLVGIEYKNCMPAWREIKNHREETAWKTNLVKELKRQYLALKQKGKKFG